ncbi:MAG: rhomboid family intramembrane serine protease [Spirochaetaceae bacterium]|nr:rhomboid family intramembrane serine protease [Spirochaetaceae bacterium]
MNLLKIVRTPFRYVFFNATFFVIGFNLLVFLLTNMMRELGNYLALNVILVHKYKMYWQFFTYMFVHGDFSHLFFNMLGLFFFGLAVEQSLGSKEFLLIYFISGIFCGITSYLFYLFTGAYYVFLIGASGAINSLLLAYAVIFPRNRIYLMGILPIPAPLLVAIYAGIEITSQLLTLRNGIAHMTQLTGFAFAWLYFMIRMGINPWKIWKDAYR